jgi:hypothetical protein
VEVLIVMTPEVSRFLAEVMYTGRRHACDGIVFRTEFERYMAAVEQWQRTETRILAAGKTAEWVGDLPAWVLDLARELAVREAKAAVSRFCRQVLHASAPQGIALGTAKYVDAQAQWLRIRAALHAAEGASTKAATAAASSWGTRAEPAP